MDINHKCALCREHRECRECRECYDHLISGGQLYCYVFTDEIRYQIRDGLLMCRSNVDVGWQHSVYPTVLDLLFRGLGIVSKEGEWG